MLLHDAAGSVVVVSAESVKMAGEGCIVLNARAVYIHNQALTPEQAAIVKRGVTATRWCAASSPYPTKCKWR